MNYGIEDSSTTDDGDRDTVSDIDGLNIRLTAVEDKVARLTDDGVTTRAVAALADRDVSEFKAAMSGHTRVLNALRETQIEHTAVFAEHGAILAEHSTILAEHSTILAEHSTILAEHSTILAEHTTTLAEHTTILTEHSTVLAGHTTTLAEHSTVLAGHTTTLAEHTTTLAEHGEALAMLLSGVRAILRHLGIAEEGGSEQTPGLN
jgi:DNA-binding Lrp family transcriptional regulator